MKRKVIAVKTKGKERKKLKSFLIVAVAIVTIGFFVLLGWRIYQVVEVQNTQAKALLSVQEYSTISNDRISDREKTVVLVFDLGKDGDATVLNTLSIVDVGNWRLDLPVFAAIMVDQNVSLDLRKLYHAGERLSNQTTGLEYLVEKVEQTASVKVDGYIAFDASGCDQRVSPCSIEQLAKALDPLNVWVSPNRARIGLEMVYSNFDCKALRLVLGTSYNKTSDISIKTIPVRLLQTADLHGEQVYFLRSATIFNVIQSFPVPSAIMVEQARVEVYNGTDIGGLANGTARIFKNSGINITRIEDAPLKLEKTTLYVKQYEKHESTIKIIEHDLAGNVEIVQEDPSFLTAGDIVVVVGYNSVLQ